MLVRIILPLHTVSFLSTCMWRNVSAIIYLICGVYLIRFIKTHNVTLWNNQSKENTAPWFQALRGHLSKSHSLLSSVNDCSWLHVPQLDKCNQSQIITINQNLILSLTQSQWFAVCNWQYRIKVRYEMATWLHYRHHEGLTCWDHSVSRKRSSVKLKRKEE